MATLGFEVLPSSANFVFALTFTSRQGLVCRLESGALSCVFRQAAIDNYLRISIGTDELTRLCWCAGCSLKRYRALMGLPRHVFPVVIPQLERHSESVLLAP